MWKKLTGLPWIGRLLRADRGSIAVLGALSLSSVLAMSGLAVELGAGYAAKVRNQRIADMAALGAAVAYNAASQDFDKAKATAQDIVLANGLPITSATITQATISGQSAVKVQITTSMPIRLASAVMGSGTPSYTVSNAAYASLTGNATPACILALSSSASSITATGGASVNASGCAVNSNGTIKSDNSSAKVTAKQISANAISDAAASYNQNAITTTPTTRNIRIIPNAAVDTVKAVTAVQTALCYVNKLTGNPDTDYPGGNTSCGTKLATPTTYSPTGGSDWNLSYQLRSAGGIYAYQDADYSCKYYPPVGNYTIGTLNVGSCTIVFAAGSTLNVDTLSIGGGGSFTYRDGALRVTNTLTLGGGVTVNIGNGYHSFGGISVGGGSSLIVGSGSLNVAGKLAVDGGGSNVYFALAAGDTVTIGAASGAAISVAGGAKLCFTSACSTPTAVGGTFSANGSVSTTGGSTLVLPTAATHVINGDLALSSGAVFGKGLYIIAGNWTNGTGGAMTGLEVTFALGGAFNFAGGTSFDLAAPGTGSPYGITDMLILSKTSAATSISAGSNGKASGLIYAPKSDFSSSGGSSISSNGSACMMLVVNTIAVSGSGTINTANCPSQSSSSAGGTVSLLQ